MDLRQELFKNQDLDYKAFHTKLVPNINPDTVIGVRVPILRKIAKQAFKENAVNHCEYYEEKMIKGFTLGLKKCDLDEHIEDIKAFVPMIDNWAICDMCVSSFKFIKKYQDEMLDFVLSYIGKSEYETRFAVVILMGYYLDDQHIDLVLDTLKSIDSDYYYVNMAVGWAIATAYCKFEDKTAKLLEAKVLPADAQNKAIQKIRESLRVSKEQKEYVATLRIKRS